MRVIVTRPEPECSRWVQALEQHGLQALALPLLTIGAVQDPDPVHTQWRQLAGYRAVMFVSGAAVQHFFALKPPDVPALPPGPRCWAPGPGTAAALVRHGVASDRIDAPAVEGGQFDSEALWQVVGQTVQPGDRVLLVRGATGEAAEGSSPAEPPPGAGRDWLAHTLQAAGADVRTVVAYERGAPRWTAAQQAQAREAAHDGSLWLFTSSQAVLHLRTSLPGQAWQRARALATHARVVQAAREAGFGVVRESRPRVADVVASIESGA